MRGIATRAAVFPETDIVGLDALLPRPADASRDADVHEALGGARTAVPAERVTAVLAAAYEAPAGGDFARLSIAVRHAALLRLALGMGRWPAWFVARCAACGELADLGVGAEEFRFEPPAEPAAGPSIDVGGPDGERRRFMIPNGAHEAALYDTALAENGGAALASLCDLGDAPVREGAAPVWVEAFAHALRRAMPTVVHELPFDCPSCGARGGFWFDPMAWIARHSAHVFRDVDRLARSYGWAEADILAMSVPRRAVYLAMIEGAA